MFNRAQNQQVYAGDFYREPLGKVVDLGVDLEHQTPAFVLRVGTFAYEILHQGDRFGHVGQSNPQGGGQISVRVGIYSDHRPARLGLSSCQRRGQRRFTDAAFTNYRNFHRTCLE